MSGHNHKQRRGKSHGGPKMLLQPLPLEMPEIEIEPEAEAEAEAEACEFFDDVVVVFVVQHQQHQCPPPRPPEKWKNVLITKTMMMLFPVAVVVASFYTPLYLSKSNLLTLHDLILRGFIQKEISLCFSSSPKY